VGVLIRKEVDLNSLHMSYVMSTTLHVFTSKLQTITLDIV